MVERIESLKEKLLLARIKASDLRNAWKTAEYEVWELERELAKLKIVDSGSSGQRARPGDAGAK
jgi:hypothetical protein